MITPDSEKTSPLYFDYTSQLISLYKDETSLMIWNSLVSSGSERRLTKKHKQKKSNETVPNETFFLIGKKNIFSESQKEIFLTHTA